MRLSEDIELIKALKGKVKSAEKDLRDHFSGMHIHCPVNVGDEVQCNRGSTNGELIDVDDISIIRYGYHHAFLCKGRIKRLRADGKQTHSRGTYLISFKELQQPDKDKS